MMNFNNFQKTALEGNGIQNDSTDVWVEVDGEQYTVSVQDVLGREEKEPFEASAALEDDLEHPAWEDLYSQYVEDMQGDEDDGDDISGLTYEVYEDNAGSLHMFVLDEDGTVIWGHSGYADNPGSLQDDILALEDAAADDVRDWDGRMDDLESSYQEMTSWEYGQEHPELVADSVGIYPDCMGCMAKEAFGIRE